MAYLPDAYDMWDAHEFERERQLRRRPICHECCEHIQEDHAWQFNGRYICQQCLDEHKVDIEER